MDFFPNPGLWVAGSLVLAMLATNASWLIGRRLGGWRPIAVLLSWPGGPALRWLLVALFLLLPPLAAWRSGALSLYALGLGELAWLTDLSVGGPLAFAICGTILLGWLIYRRSPARPEGFREALGGRGTSFSSPRWLAPLNAILWQWHWAFYRAAAIGWLASGVADSTTLAEASAAIFSASGPAALSLLARVAQEISAQVAVLLTTLSAQPLYWGSWLGLGLSALEWSLNPFARADLHIAGRLEGSASLIAMAIATTALFATTRNFWLCLACHLLVETFIAGFFPVPSTTH